MRHLALFAFAFLLTPCLRAEGRPWTTSEVIESAKRKAKVVIQGKIERAINFDYFVLTDDSGAIILNAAGVRHRLAVGDKIVVWGRYLGRSDRYPQARAEIEAIEMAPVDTPEAARILEGRTAPAPVPDVSANPPAPDAAPAVSLSIESRLRTLEDLKEKKLISDDEYKDTRKRILNDL